MNVPLPNTYWVLPDRLLAGEHPYGAHESDARDRLARLCAAGIDYFIDLTELAEMPDYSPLLPPQTEYLRSEIVDMSVPRQVAHMQTLQSQIRAALARERRIYVHCRAGIGRTGLVVGCYLAEQSLDGKAALRQLNRLWQQSERAKSWPKVPQTPQQADYVRAWPRHHSGGKHTPR